MENSAFDMGSTGLRRFARNRLTRLIAVLGRWHARREAARVLEYLIALDNHALFDMGLSRNDLRAELRALRKTGRAVVRRRPVSAPGEA